MGHTVRPCYHPLFCAKSGTAVRLKGQRPASSVQSQPSDWDRSGRAAGEMKRCTIHRYLARGRIGQSANRGRKSRRFPPSRDNSRARGPTTQVEMTTRYFRIQDETRKTVQRPTTRINVFNTQVSDVPIHMYMIKLRGRTTRLSWRGVASGPFWTR